MIIDCISDLHGHYPKLKSGDLLIVGGDLTARDTEYQHDDFFVWINSQTYKKKIFIGGNHDNYIQNNNEKFIKTLEKSDLEYLCDSGAEFKGLKIWGSPWTKTFEGMNPKCKAFTVDTEEELAEKWALIPDDVDILITHSPPYGILDFIPLIRRTPSRSLLTGCRHIGSETLYEWLKYTGRPKLHVFGHVHEAHGQEERLPTYNDKMMISINASHVNEYLEPVNKPIRIEL